MTTTTAPAAGIWATFRDAPLALKTILVGVFVSRLSGFLNIFVVLYLTARGYSPAQAAAALGVYGAGSVVGVLIGGALADRLGARNATVASMSGAAVLTAALLYLPNYPTLLVAVGLVALAAQIYRPASATLLSTLVRQDRQVMTFAMYRFGLNVGAMAAPLIGFALYHVSNEQYTLLFWAEALVALAYAALAQATLPARVPASTDETGAESTAAAETPQRASYLSLLKDRRYVYFLIGELVNAAVYVQYLSMLPLDIKASGLPIFWYTFAVSLNGLVVICIELLVTKVTQTWPMRVPILLGPALVGVGMAVYALPLVPAVIIIGTLVWTVAEVIGAPSSFAYPAVASPPHLRGRYIGSFQFMFGLGSAIGPVIGGALFTVLGHRAWLPLAALSIISVAFLLPGVPRQQRTQVATDPVIEPATSPS